MVLNTTVTTVDSPPATQQDTLELLLQDREWVTTQFAAIMTASGFGDRVILGILPDSPPDHIFWTRGGNAGWRLVDRLPAARFRSRVRSPPDRW